MKFPSPRVADENAYALEISRAIRWSRPIVTAPSSWCRRRASIRRNDRVVVKTRDGEVMVQGTQTPDRQDRSNCARSMPSKTTAVCRRVTWIGSRASCGRANSACPGKVDGGFPKRTCANARKVSCRGSNPFGASVDRFLESPDRGDRHAAHGCRVSATDALFRADAGRNEAGADQALDPQLGRAPSRAQRPRPVADRLPPTHVAPWQSHGVDACAFRSPRMAWPSAVRACDRTTFATITGGSTDRGYRHRRLSLYQPRRPVPAVALQILVQARTAAGSMAAVYQNVPPANS